MKIGLWLCGFACLLSLSARAESVEYSPKLAARTSFGLLSNAGTLGGSASEFGSLDLAYLYFLNSQFAVGGGYHYDFDFSAGATPLYGFNFLGRYYFGGSGTVVRKELPYMTSETHSWISYYTGIELAQRSFSSGGPSTSGSSSTASSTAIQNISGSYLNGNILLGADFKWSRHIELTGELNYTLLSFAASDERVKIKNTLFQFGINYVW